MHPREASQPWPTSIAPVPAWTKTIGGDAYTVKRITGDLFGIWRDAEELGTFELTRGHSNELEASHSADLTLEARAALQEFLLTFTEPFEGAARRDG